jgi:hypothetical protein
MKQTLETDRCVTSKLFKSKLRSAAKLSLSARQNFARSGASLTRKKSFLPPTGTVSVLKKPVSRKIKKVLKNGPARSERHL